MYVRCYTVVTNACDWKISSGICRLTDNTREHTCAIQYSANINVRYQTEQIVTPEHLSLFDITNARNKESQKMSANKECHCETKVRGGTSSYISPINRPAAVSAHCMCVIIDWQCRCFITCATACGTYRHIS